MDDIKKLQAVRKLASELESKVEQKQAKAQQSTMQAIDLVVSAFKKFKEDVKAQMEVVRSIPPEKGDKGEKGDPGLPGANGKDGRDGKDGKDGQDGQDGVSVVDARLDFDGHLVMVLSNGTEIDAGVLAPEKASEIYATLKQTIDGGGGSALTISDEGVTLTSGATKINFVGATVTASATGDEVTVNVSAGTGSVTSVDLSVPTGFAVSGNPITTSGTLALAYAAGYSLPTNVKQSNWDDAYTAVTNLGTISTQDSDNVSITGGSITGITDLAVADGGTGASTASGARTNLLPSYAGNAGKVLAVNGGATDVEWVTAGSGSGTVTSVDVSGGTTGLTTSGGPITSSGTITLAGTLAIANGGTGQTTASGAINALLPSQTGNSGKYLTTDGSVASWATVSGGGGGITVNIQDFSTPGSSTWTKPSGVSFVCVILVGAGGGGGGGGRYATTSARYGGGGGGGGATTVYTFPASYVGATETITVGAGGAGGASRTADSTIGNSGSSGGHSQFGSLLRAAGGSQGLGGSTSSGAAGVGAVTGGGQSISGTAGGSASTVGANVGISTGAGAATGGGSGASRNANITTGAAGADGGSLNAGTSGNIGGPITTAYNTSNGGSSSGGNGSAGTSSIAVADRLVGRGGGGGGYATGIATGSGGNGGSPGGGGGGGAASDNGFASGAGGTGGDGFVRVISW